MNTAKQLPGRFRELVHKSLDGTVIASEVEEIASVLRERKDARSWYAEVVMLHNDLLAHSEANEMCKQLQEEFPGERANESSLRRSSLRKGASSSSWTQAYRAMSRWALAASVLLVGIGAGCGVGIYAASVINVWPEFTPIPWTWKVGNDVIGRIDRTDSVVWQASDVPETLPTQGLRAGQQIRIDSGHVSLSLRTGASAILEGPAVFELRSDRGGKLFNGKLSLISPPEVGSFTVATPVGMVNCGAGHFGVEVNNSNAKAGASFHAISGGPLTGSAARLISVNDVQHDFGYGESLHVDADGQVREVRQASVRGFLSAMPPARWRRFSGDVIPLGNLFDDSKSASLEEAINSDTFQAAGETIDLGVAAVRDGKLDVDVALAEHGVLFNFKNVGGGGPRVKGLPGNDTFRSVSATPIRTTGVDFKESELGAKIEDGVGMSTNELLTFDLDEIRQSGRLGTVPMRFVADRVGLNDREPPALVDRRLASARFVVVVSTTDRVLAGYVDGKEFPVTQQGEVHQFAWGNAKLPKLIRRDGNFVAFDVPIPPEAKYLSLATTMHDVEHDDHAVFSGARLELVRDSVRIAQQQ